MPDALIERLRKTREAKVKTGKYTFTVRRPTDEEAYAHFRQETPVSTELLVRFITGWDLTEADILPGGDGKKKVEFDPELAREWLADNSPLWAPLLDKISELYKSHAESREAGPKN